MKKSRLTVLISGTLLLGFVLGLIAAGLIWMHFVRRSVASTLTAAGVMQEVTELREIRDGNSKDAAGLLELHLDGDIIALGMKLDKVSPGRRDPQLVSALEQAHDYRQIFPHKADSPEDAALIKKAFNLVSGKKSPRDASRH